MPALTLLRSLRILLCIVLLASVGLFVLWSWRWPLIGDASLIHYICFLMDHGMAPYRDLGDMNMPGALLVEWTIMHVLGGGDLAWRIFDFALLLAAAAAMQEIVRPYDWFAGVFAASLFALVHGRDGLVQAGQRDLTMAVLLLLATAFLLRALRRTERWDVIACMTASGLCAGVAATIKPTALLFDAVLFLIAAMAMRKRGVALQRYIAPVFLAFLAAPIAAFVFLWRWQALAAFVDGLRTVVPYYASLGHRPMSFLLTHCISPLLPLVLLWVVVLVLSRPKLNTDRTLLLAGMVLGLASYILQPRGFPYYRYPLLAFLLPLMAIDFVTALEAAEGWRSQLRRGFAVAALAVGGLFLAPVSAWSIHQFEWWNLEFISSLEQNIRALGGSGLSGQIQCIDSISGCGTMLYRMGLVQSTGVLSDFLLFGPEQVPIVHRTREQFLAAIAAHPPKVIVVSSWLHTDGPDNYEKLNRWPALQDYLASQYVIRMDWRPQQMNKWWSRREWPKGYRVYVLKSSSLQGP